MGYDNEDEDCMYTELDAYEQTVNCNYCGKPYRQMLKEQVAGFRDKSEDICPHCHRCNGTSMSWDYRNYSLT